MARKKTTATGRKTKSTAKTATKARTTAKSAKRAPAKSAARKTATRTTAASRKSTTKRATTTARRSVTKPDGFSLPSTAISSKQTKAQIYAEIAEITEVDKKEVKKVFAALKNVVERHVKPKGSGEVTIPELGIKVRRVVKKATKKRKGRNPFTGEEITIAAKPARKSVKATALKALKELA